MPYTLAKGFVWFALALLLGIVIGWLLRSIAAKRQVERARAQHADVAEMERLRGRVANLEPVVAERDRLLDELEQQRAASPPPPAVVAPPDDRDPVAGAATAASTNGDPAGGPSPPSTPDVAGGAAVLGRAIELDDLKVVEGIGPKIESLCHGIGIRTWFDLASTEVSLLRTMLTDAGARFKSHDPTTWPRQADLLANGRWEEFRAFAEALRGGRAGD